MSYFRFHIQVNIAWYLSFSFCHMHRLLRDLDLSSIPSSAFYMLLDTGKVNSNSLISQMGTIIPAYKGCCKLKWEHVYKALSKVPAQWKVKVKVLVMSSDSATPWTVACQAPLSREFSRQEYWSGLPVPSPGDLPNPGTKPRSPALQADSLPSEPPAQ